MLRSLILFIGISFISLFQISTAISQPLLSINGTVKDASSGEVLIGASMYLLENPQKITLTNAYGFFSISAIPGNYQLVTLFAGYRADTVSIQLTGNKTVVIKLKPIGKELEEVVVSSSRKNDQVTKPLMGVQKLTVKEMNNVPVIFGEKDVLKTIQLLPGVKSAGEGNSGFYVRGGGADQNLILLDEATVYNASHVLGFFSSFNSDAIKDLTLYKGAMPAEYGGRLASVVDVKMIDGNNQAFHASGGVGLIASRLNLEGPLVKDKGSFILSGRRTYADVFLGLSRDSSIRDNSLYFYDFNAKANFTINSKNRLFLSGYFGRDKLGFGKTFGIDYGNSTGTLRWNHIFNGRLFLNNSLIYSNYNYNIEIKSGVNNLVIKSKIEDLALKTDFQYFINNDNKINFGTQVTRHLLSPGIVDASASSSFNSQALPVKTALEAATYFNHEYAPNAKLRLNYGIRLTSFSLLGPGNFSTYDSASNIIQTTVKTGSGAVKTYLNPEPRFSASWLLNPLSSFKASYTRNVQNLHLLSNSAAINPTDIWIPSSLQVKPEIADQVAIGYYKNDLGFQYEFFVEAYYKWMQNQVDYKNGAQLRANENVESQLLFGSGRAYGLEWFLKKKTGKLTGWISYTLARTERSVPGINNGNWYPARQDQTHNLAIVGIYQTNSRWTLSANWVYNTGNAVTFPSGKYTLNGQTAYYYTERNGYRFPDYHRLDLAATLKNKPKAGREGSWTFSLYNAYGRENTYSIEFKDDPNNPGKTIAEQTALFKWVPSITYNFKF
jgi:CarboxypepD_reg-like domain/TonB-dependent Receptor Plug Domain